MCKQRMEDEFRRIAINLMHGEEVDPLDVAYARGFFAGMKYLLDKPKVTNAEIQRELAKRERAERKEVALSE